MNIKVLIFSYICFILSNIATINAQQTNLADSVDILHYDIHLKMINLSTKKISGHTTLKITPKANSVNKVRLHLLKLNIDSIKSGNINISTYQYNDTLINITLPNLTNIGDTFSLSVFYQGIPQIDASGWGGFYFSSDSNYAFNLGVGFQASPHSYGRVWFPCIDEFPEKALFDTYITVKGDKKAICGGTLISEINNPDNTKTFHWKMRDPIPTYLASVAVGKYVAVNDTFSGINGNIPINIYVPAGDTIDAKNSFINLKSILQIFENNFGPYLWERIGYVGVPFNNGAMEHSTNIAYPLFAIDGTLNNESLYAHELSHQWFGDLVTCATEMDMWINEGWATYCEAIYREHLYGYDSYLGYVLNNHLNVIQTAHLIDDGYRAVYGIPSEYTYSTTVYDKGADMVHTLRYYMGDNLFFPAVKAMLNQYKFKNISTIQMRDFLSSHSGINLNDFFQAWIFSPGFPHFAVDSFHVISNTPIKVKVWVRQKLNHAPSYANSNKVELTFAKNNFSFYSDTMSFSGATGSKEFILPFVPDFIMMDYYEKISDAITTGSKKIKAAGTYTFVSALCNLEVTNINDSALVRLEHNWVAPDPLKNPNSDIKRLSDYHYWKIDGIFPSSFVSKGKFKYSRLVSTATGNLDNILLPTSSSVDSLLLLYRKGASYDWEQIHFTRYGTSTSGYLIIDTLRRGEYTFAVGKPYTSGTQYPLKTGYHFDVHPNPSQNSFTFILPEAELSELRIYNELGQQVESFFLQPYQKSLVWLPFNKKPAKYYAVLLDSEQTIIADKKLLFIK